MLTAQRGTSPATQSGRQGNQLIGLTEVSRMLGVNRATVANWLRQGRIPALQYGERGIYRLRRDDVLSFIERSRLPQEAEAS